MLFLQGWSDKQMLDELGYQSKFLLLEQSNIYPCVKVNNISSNPNKQSFVYFAVGYQVGFVRITSMKDLGETT